MPKSLITSHLVLLTCLSFLVFPLLAMHFDGTGGREPTGTVTHSVAIAAAGLSLIMVITEMFSGARWLAMAAAAGAWAGLCLPPFSAWAWALGWVAVALWFAVLAARQRRDR